MWRSHLSPTPPPPPPQPLRVKGQLSRQQLKQSQEVRARGSPCCILLHLQMELPPHPPSTTDFCRKVHDCVDLGGQ